MRTLIVRQPAIIVSPIRKSLPGRILEALVGWQRRASDRRQLALMDETMLKDIGVTRLDAEQEASKPFWRE
jgi:uncharacterized protein YjiS (DUF1127 family)